jgi:hypothetical protein
VWFRCFASLPDEAKGTLMRGTVAKKGKRWYAVVYDGIDPATGKKRRRWVSAGTRRGDAEQLLASLIQRKYEGEPVVTDKVTVGRYLVERWLPIQKTRLRASTYDAYRRNIDLHVLPALGRRPLDKLTAEDVDLFYAKLLTEGRKNNKGDITGLAPKTVRNVHVMLNKALSDAVRKGAVVRNVIDELVSLAWERIRTYPPNATARSPPTSSSTWRKGSERQVLRRAGDLGHVEVPPPTARSHAQRPEHLLLQGQVVRGK